MKFTDIFIRRPVLATVVSLLILVLGLRSINSLPIRQYPFTQNAVITVTTVFFGADPTVVAGFITTPLEYSIAQANGIDYITSTSTQNVSTISVYLRLNYDPLKALSDINAKVNATLNQLPKESQLPTIAISIGQTIDAMFLGFYSDTLSGNQITDYLTRVVQPKLQTISGVQVAEILGNRQFAMRAWLDAKKLAGYGLTSADVATALAKNDFISTAGRTDGTMFTLSLSANTGLSTVEQFRNLVVKSQNGAIIRLGDVAKVSLGATNYDSSVSFDGQSAIYIGIELTPDANLLSVIRDVKKEFAPIQRELPQGLNAKIVYDSSDFVNSSIHEVIFSIIEALVIVTIVIFMFLGSLRSVIIPLIAIPLSLIGAFFIMLLLHYSINLLTLLALVLAIGLVVDDAIIIVENIQRHIEQGMTPIKASIQGARELANPIIAISAVLIAVYLPIGFLGGLTGALFTEFAFTLAGAVAVSAIVALTLSPIMCAKFLRPMHEHPKDKIDLVAYIDRQFERLRKAYEKKLQGSLDNLKVTAVFSIIILISIYFLFVTSKSELAPVEDQGIILTQVTTSPNASLDRTKLYSNQIYQIYKTFPETERVFQLDGIAGLNTAIVGMGLKPWDKRPRSSNTLQPLVQQEIDENISGALAAVFQLPPLPGARGFPIQFAILSTDPFERINEVNQSFIKAARASGLFLFLDTDLKIDKQQANLILDRDKAAILGLTMQDIGLVLARYLSQGFINYFNYSGRSYQVIPQLERMQRLNQNQILNTYIPTGSGQPILLSTIAKLKNIVAPQSLNHFQQLNSATLLGVAAPGITMGETLDKLKEIANKVLPPGYTVDYGGQARQFIQESAGLVSTFFLAMIIIYLSLAALFESYRDPLIVLISVPMSICGALIFISMGIGGASLNIYTEVGLVTLIGLISKHGILIVQFANDLQEEGKSKREAVEMAAGLRLRPILMTTAAMVLGVLPLVTATGAGAVSRFNIGLVLISGLSIGTLFTLFVVPAMYLFLAKDHSIKQSEEDFYVPEEPLT